jgi:DNA polymerase-3 subunit beta
MKVIFDRAALLAAVNNVASCVPSRSPQAVLSCVKIVATKSGSVGEVNLLGSDGETSLQLTLTAVDVAQPGVAVVSADKLRQIVQAVENEPTLTLDLEGDVCRIRGSASIFKVFAFPVDDYPAFPEYPTTGTPPRATLILPSGSLLSMVNKTVFATAKETSRYAINGVLLKRDGKKIEMVATDGRRLALCRTTLKPSLNAGSEGGSAACIIPTKALGMLGRVIAAPDESVRITLTDNRIFFAFEESPAGDAEKPEKGKKEKAAAAGSKVRAVLSSTLVEGAFPPYEDVIPKDQDKKATVDRDALAAAVREAKILTNEESRGVRMAFSGKSKKLKLTSRAPEMGESEVDVSVSDYQGEDLEISFNPEFIADVMRAIEEPEVVLELKAANKPGILRSGTDFTYVVMPVNLPA